MHIFVRTLRGKTVTLELGGQESILDVKDLLHVKDDTPVNQHNLIFQGKFLEDERSIVEYGIEPDSTLHSVGNLPGGVQIVVKTTKGATMELDVDLNDTVGSLKSRLQELQGIPAADIRLTLRGKNLDDEATLSSQSLKEKSVLLMMPTKKQPTEKEAKKEEEEPAGPPVQCLGGCGFWGSSKTKNYCSKCYADLGIANQSAPAPAEKKEEVVEKAEEKAGESSRPVQQDTTRCWQCKKRVGLLGYACKCEYVFCAKHRYSDQHECSYDYKADARKNLQSQVVPTGRPKQVDIL